VEQFIGCEAHKKFVSFRQACVALPLTLFLAEIGHWEAAYGASEAVALRDPVMPVADRLGG
jgi:hypothetical protein